MKIEKARMHQHKDTAHCKRVRPTRASYLASSVNLGSFWKLTGTDSQYGTVSSQINGTHNNLFTYAYAFLTPNEEITEILLGGTGNDLISGSYDADYIDGGNDNDVLYGNSGNDFMFGGQVANDNEWRVAA